MSNSSAHVTELRQPAVGFRLSEECPILLAEIIRLNSSGDHAIGQCGSKDKRVMEGYVILLFNVRNIFRGK